MVYLRHRKLPLMVVYRDPKKSWDKGIEDYLLKELKKDGFKNFVETEISMEEFLEGLLVHI